MNPLSILQITELAGAKLEQGDGQSLVERVSTDSRTIKRGELFVALRGENFDAHQFLTQVIERGAAGAMISQNAPANLPPEFAMLRVADTLIAYQSLAANYRKSLPLQAI